MIYNSRNFYGIYNGWVKDGVGVAVLNGQRPGSWECGQSEHKLGIIKEDLP